MDWKEVVLDFVSEHPVLGALLVVLLVSGIVISSAWNLYLLYNKIREKKR
ncbi:hypothetical protein HPY42_03350 [Coprothermobacteraceae bacterium]|nr:hypothetical protein [Coprothermobacteraceae bacterium]